MSHPHPVDLEPYAIEVNFKPDIGADFPYAFIWKEVNDPDFPLNPEDPPTGMDLTNCVGTMEIKTAYESSTVLLSPTVVLEENEAGEIAFTVTAAQIAGLLPRKKHVYTLNITFPSGFVRSFARGRFDLTYR